jgi:hypothetical protein
MKYASFFWMGCQVHGEPPHGSINTWRLSATPFSTHSQLPCVCRSCLLHPQSDKSPLAARANGAVTCLAPTDLSHVSNAQGPNMAV